MLQPEKCFAFRASSLEGDGAFLELVEVFGTKADALDAFNSGRLEARVFWYENEVLEHPETIDVGPVATITKLLQLPVGWRRN